MPLKRWFLIWPSVSLVFVIISIVLLVQVFSLRDQMDTLMIELEQEKLLHTEAKERAVALQNAADDVHGRFAQFKEILENRRLYHSSLTRTEQDSLRLLGLDDPENDIIDSLIAHPEIIPHKGWGGIRCGFYNHKDIVVLGPSRIQALFDDGHYIGHLLAEYEVTADGRINWTVLESMFETD
jgi:hypothetical protein